MQGQNENKGTVFTLKNINIMLVFFTFPGALPLNLLVDLATEACVQLEDDFHSP